MHAQNTLDLSFFAQMLGNGCISGAVQLELTPIAALLSTLLPFNIQVDRESSKSTVINANNISIYDLSLILPQLKLNCLRFLSSLLRSSSLSLSKIGTGVLRPLSVLLAMPSPSVDLTASTLACFSQATSCFPTLLPRVAIGGIIPFVTAVTLISQ